MNRKILVFIFAVAVILVAAFVPLRKYSCSKMRTQINEKIHRLNNSCEVDSDCKVFERFSPDTCGFVASKNAGITELEGTSKIYNILHCAGVVHSMCGGPLTAKCEEGYCRPYH